MAGWGRGDVVGGGGLFIVVVVVTAVVGVACAVGLVGIVGVAIVVVAVFVIGVVVLLCCCIVSCDSKKSAWVFDWTPGRNKLIAKSNSLMIVLFYHPDPQKC